MPSQPRTMVSDRRKFLTDSSMALAAVAGSSLVGASSLAWALPETAESVEVKTAYGRLRGTRVSRGWHSEKGSC